MPFSLLTTPITGRSPTRRRLLAMMAGGLLPVPSSWALPTRELRFPRDHGSHPDLRTEWWYATGHAESADGARYGFQLTFFRSRVEGTQSLESAFAARQLLFAHAALTDLQAGQLHHDQRIARAGFGIADASEEDTRVRLRDWSLMRDPSSGAYMAEAPGADFGLSLRLQPTQPVLLQGQAGLSRKGPDPSQASYYYSQPQLAVEGRIAVAGRPPQPVRGRAWLDHEWSQALLHPDAVGWDWVGMNLEDGSALTAFRLRRANGSALWAGGSWRPPGGAVQVFDHDSVHFEPLRFWTSPLSRARYPVQWRIRTPAGSFEVRALVDNQELDSRASTGAIYWEGLSALLDTSGRQAGRGYLEMTGYAHALKL